MKIFAASSSPWSAVGEHCSPIHWPQDCYTWARVGECESNEAFMRAACAEACMMEKNGTLPEPEEATIESCTHWAQSGLCETDRRYMRSIRACRKAYDEVGAHAC